MYELQLKAPMRGLLVQNTLYIRRPSNELIAIAELHPPHYEINFKAAVSDIELGALQKALKYMTFHLAYYSEFDFLTVRARGLAVEIA